MALVLEQTREQISAPILVLVPQVVLLASLTVLLLGCKKAQRRALGSRVAGWTPQALQEAAIGLTVLKRG